MSRRPRETLSHYRLIERLGRGGMGEVWLAEDTDLPRQVAIKILAPHLAENESAMARLQREAQAMAAINHPAVVTVYEAGQAEGIPYIVMQKLDGETLAERLLRGPLPVAEVVQVMTRIADALAEVHALGVVHRDLKPSNIVLTSRGPVVLDFGLASMETQTRLTQDGASVGTPLAMSPEQINGLPPDNRSDLWSLGVIFYEALTGTPPFQADAKEALFYQILNVDPKPPSTASPDVSPDLDYIVLKLLRKNVDHRYLRAEDLLGDLANFASRMSGAQTADRIDARRAALPRLAVLPFEMLSADADDRFLAAGLLEDLIIDFTRVGGLEVASRADVVSFTDPSVPPRTIARRLNVDYVLLGSVRRAGNRGRISAQLVRADGHTLWADRFDRTLDDLFDVQAEISKKIVSALQIALKPGESDMLTRAPTKVPEAYTLYLKARELIETTPDDNERAGRLLKQALALDPDFALAHAALGWCYAYRGVKWWAGVEVAEEAMACARRALDLEPLLPEAYNVELLARRLQGDAEGVLRAIDKVLSVSPEDAQTLEAAAWSYMALGKPEQALPILEKAIAKYEHNVAFSSLLLNCYEMLGRDEDALRVIRRDADMNLALLERDPGNATARSRLAVALAKLGESEEAIRQVDRADALAPDDGRVHYNLACTYAKLGRPDDAVAQLKQAVKNLPSHLSDWPTRDPDLESLHGHPEFKRLFGPTSA
jgi:non-specific serine/threonine protein kinase